MSTKPWVSGPPSPWNVHGRAGIAVCAEVIGDGAHGLSPLQSFFDFAHSGGGTGPAPTRKAAARHTTNDRIAKRFMSVLSLRQSFLRFCASRSGALEQRQ